MPDESFSADPDVVLDHRWRVFVRNASDLPVYRVRLTWYESEQVLGAHQMMLVLAPATEPMSVPAPEHVLTEWKTTWGSGGTRPVAPVDRLGVEIQFVDAAGIDWRRDLRGALARTDHGGSTAGAPWWKFDIGH